MRKDVIRVALICLATTVAVAMIQQRVQVPLLGPYLPGGTKV